MRISELRDRLPRAVESRRSGFLCAVCGTLVHAEAAWWGVKLGPRCRFFGMPVLRRAAGSAISIDEDCTFRSARSSNLAGINRPCYISTLQSDAEVTIGARSGFSGTVVAAAKSVQIGRDVLCGVNTFISDTDWHPRDPVDRLLGHTGSVAPVVIEDNVWLGANVIVLKGVTIGRNSVIGAGSVVSKSIPPNSVATGTPACMIRELEVHA